MSIRFLEASNIFNPPFLRVLTNHVHVDYITIDEQMINKIKQVFEEHVVENIEEEILTFINGTVQRYGFESKPLYYKDGQLVKVGLVKN